MWRSDDVIHTLKISLSGKSKQKHCNLPSLAIFFLRKMAPRHCVVQGCSNSAQPSLGIWIHVSPAETKLYSIHFQRDCFKQLLNLPAVAEMESRTRKDNFVSREEKGRIKILFILTHFARKQWQWSGTHTDKKEVTDSATGDDFGDNEDKDPSWTPDTTCSTREQNDDTGSVVLFTYYRTLKDD